MERGMYVVHECLPNNRLVFKYGGEVLSIPVSSEKILEQVLDLCKLLIREDKRKQVVRYSFKEPSVYELPYLFALLDLGKKNGVRS